MLREILADLVVCTQREGSSKHDSPLFDTSFIVEMACPSELLFVIASPGMRDLNSLASVGCEEILKILLPPVLPAAMKGGFHFSTRRWPI